MSPAAILALIWVPPALPPATHNAGGNAPGNPDFVKVAAGNADGNFIKTELSGALPPATPSAIQF